MSETALLVRLIHQNTEVSQALFDRSMVRVGRGAECELQLPDPTISHIHCVLRRKDGEWIFEDTSRNGLSLTTGEPVAARLKLERLLRVRLGRVYEIEFDPRPSATASELSKEKTILLTHQSTQLLHFTSGKVKIGKASLRYRDNSGQERIFPIESQGLSLGSHPSNDVVLDSPLVSQFHARLDFIQNEYVVTDLDSTNGLLVNGLPVQRAPLAESQTLRLGDSEIAFILKSQEHEITPKSESHFMGMVSKDSEMQKLFSICEVVATTDAPVFIQGETGAGKELLAKAIHDLSNRFDRPFIALNCAALPDELVESELFGHEKGAFTGAIQTRIGAFEAANGGTLFLDEIAELDLTIQAKILRALESGEIKRVGSNTPLHVSVRIVSATHKDLKLAVEQQRFREDLFFRLHVVPLELPPLRERRGDLELLIPYLLEKMGSKLSISAEAIESLQRHPFPGNIRELKNILQRASVLYEVQSRTKKPNDGILSLDHFRFLDDLKHFKPAKSQAEMNERDSLIEALAAARYNQSEAARRLGLPISTFHDRMRRYGLEREARSKIAS